MKVEELLQNVDRKWHGEFLHFIETGEAGDEFLRYLDHDKGGERAVEMAFNTQAAAFEGLAEELKKGPKVEETTEPTAAASARMVEAMEVVVQLSPGQREAVAQKTASTLEASLEKLRINEVSCTGILLLAQVPSLICSFSRCSL